MSSGAPEPADELEFSFCDMDREILEFTRIAVAGDFLAPGGEELLDRFRRGLAQIQSSAPLAGTLRGRLGRVYDWCIFEDEPLLTRPSRRFERGGRAGGHDMCAKITAIWQIRPRPKPKKSMDPATFCIAGKGSVKVQWYEVLEGELFEPLGMWRMEVADGASPGCYFHVQIEGEDGRTERPFPHSVPAPRLPCIAFTPMAVLEFVLGELFQDQWENHTRLPTTSVDWWRGLQWDRLQRLFRWQQQLINDNTAPPWTSLKCARPAVHLFLE